MAKKIQQLKKENKDRIYNILGIIKIIKIQSTITQKNIYFIEFLGYELTIKKGMIT